ncbi:hypothetical protein AB3N62_15450 [Leptospira sp. WS4.C2]
MIQKTFAIFVLFLLHACALTLISPGLNSNYRLNDITDLKFEEVAFYGSKHYSHSAFFIEFENLNLIINDVNNTTLNTNENLNINRFHKENIHLLYEICFDKEKEINIIEDLENHQFQLNDNSYESKISYFYPYSYFKKRDRFNKFNPFYMRNNYPADHVIQKTGTDFLLCVRTLLTFKKTDQKPNLNEFEILTPRNVHLFYSYEYKNQFIFYKNEGIDFSAK